MPDTEGVWDNKNFGAYARLFANMKAVNGDIKITMKKQWMNNAYTIRSARARIKYLHQCLFCPSILTLAWTEDPEIEAKPSGSYSHGGTMVLHFGGGSPHGVSTGSLLLSPARGTTLH